MIRSTKHNISKITNSKKLSFIDMIFVDYTVCLKYYIKLIIDGELPIKTNLSSNDLPNYNIKHSRYKQLIYKQASEIIRSQLKKSSERRYKTFKLVYRYFKENGRQTAFVSKKYSELNLKPLIKSRFFTHPNLKNITITLDERFFNIKQGVHFDKFVKIISPYFNEKGTRALTVNIPFKEHKHSNKFLTDDWKPRKVIQLKKVDGNYYINQVFEKDEPKHKDNGRTIGIDLGYNKLIVTSENQFIGSEMKDLYEKISKKVQGSKSFKRKLTQRDNLINYYGNQIDNIKEISTIIIEDLLNVKHKNKFNSDLNNKMQRWSYPKTIDKITRICEVNGIQLVKVSPSYTSQTCSKCGSTHEESRQGENYKCIDCGFEIDADYNASINIRNRGAYSPSIQQVKLSEFH